MQTIKTLASEVKHASKKMAEASTEQKNLALFAISNMLKEKKREILAANLDDISESKKAGLPENLIDRLSLQEGRLDGVIKEIQSVIDLSDPVGERFDKKILPNGLNISKIRTPIGVLGVIYEARPNVTVDVSCLTIKTGNAALLRGGKETLRTNLCLIDAIQIALKATNLPSNGISYVQTTDRAEVKKLLQLHESIDLIIPRGGFALHQFCRENSKIPVITGGIGICHLFVDETVDQEKALKIIDNAKTQRPSVCNALDTLLVHEKIASSFVLKVVETLSKKGVSFRAGPRVLQLANLPKDAIYEAGKEDWDTEWLSLILGIRIVKNLDEALEHIWAHSSGHSDGILTDNKEHAALFVKKVDSAAVYVNASTRFTDGAQFGLGAEVAISTQKLHARGPMGLQELTSYKWVVEGDYITRP